MAVYICGVVGVAAVGAVALSLFSREDGRALAVICRLLLLLAIASPLARLPSLVEKIGEIYSVIGDNGDESETGSGIPNEVLAALERQSRAEIAEVIGEDICRRFGLAREDVEVRPQLDVSDDGGEVQLLLVRMIFTGRAMWQDPHPVMEYIEQAYGVTCEIAEG